VKLETISAIVIVAGLGWWLLSRQVSPAAMAAQDRALIMSLPPQPTWAEIAAAREAVGRQEFVGSVASGAATGSVAGPYGAAVGAGAGAVLAFWRG